MSGVTPEMRDDIRQGNVLAKAILAANEDVPREKQAINLLLAVIAVVFSTSEEGDEMANLQTFAAALVDVGPLFLEGKTLQ